jgi:hypothetical protein
MASASIEPAESGTSRAGMVRLFVAIALPLVILLLAYGLWWISDRLLYVGPLDRAAFGWVFVVPLWLSAPVVAGFLWKAVSTRQARYAALVVGSVVSIGAALAYWQSIGTPFDCGFGTVTPPIAFLPQTLIVGILVGGGLALDGLLVAALARSGVRWWAVVVGAGTEVLMLGLALFAVLATWEGHTCFVPGPTFPVTP